MSSIAAVISWDSPDSLRSVGAQMESALGSWVADAVRVAECPGAVLGISILVADRWRGEDRQPLITDSAVAVVADCRLDNREELRAALSLGSAATDSELLVAGYERWGEGLAARLRGDFACVFWDGARRRCVAFRDPLGVKPLFYSSVPGGVAVASDTELILQLTRPKPIPDDHAVVEHLLWEYASPGRTFWSAVSRLPAGHALVVGPSGTGRATRYWTPSGRPARFANVRDVHDRFRHLFFNSVERRADSEGEVLAHLSGGLDSSLIVCAAAELRRRPGVREIRLSTVSERFPGTASDEGEFMEAVTAWTGFERSDWDGGDAEFLDLVRPSLAGPTMRTYRSSGSTGDLLIASRRNAHAILAGQGGDQIGMPTGLSDDAARRNPLHYAFATLTHRELSGADRIARLRRLARQYLPTSLRKAVARRRYRTGLPRWLQPTWRGVADDIVATFYPDDVERSFEHQVQRVRWHELTSGRMGMALALQQRVGAQFGVEFRFPYLDQDLVEFVLSIPPEHWPSPSVGSRLHREAMGDLLPPSVRARRGKAIFSDAVGGLLKRAAGQITAVFHAGDWLSEKYVRRQEAQNLLARALGGADWRNHWQEWHDVRAIATLEAWLRTVFG